MIYLNQQIIKTGTIKMAIDYTNSKTFSMRLPKELWVFYKITSVAGEEPMGDVIVRALDKYKKSVEKKQGENK